MLRKSAGRSQKQLGVENDALRARLDEAEETLSAIRNGDWDALIVSGVDGEQILTLKQSELRYRRLFEAAQDGILILDAETGAITDVNPFLITMLGYSREEFVEKKLWEVGAFKDIEDSQAAFEALQANEYIRYDDMPLRAKDGRLIQVEFVSNVYQVDGKKVIQCNIRDITVRKQAEAQILHQASMLESVNDAIVASDAQSQLTVWNAAAESLYGWKAEEVLGRNGVDLLRLEWPAAEVEQMQRTIAETGRWRGEATQQRKDGTRFPVEVSWLVLRDEREQITGYISVNRDITARKQAEEQVRAARQILQSVQDSLSAHIAILDQEGKIVQVNSTWRDFGAQNGLRHSNHCIGMNYLEVCDSAKGLQAGEAALVAQAIRAVGTGGQDEIGVEYPCHAPNEQRWFVAHITSFENNERKWIVVAHENITARKHAQEKMQRQLEHLTALSAIDQIIATSFDLRLSLSQILSHVTTELGMDAADILTLNPNSQILEFCAERGFRGRTIRKGQVRLGESYAGRVALERQLVQIPNLGAEPNSLFLTTHLMGEDFIGYYGVPLMAKGQVNGVLEVFRRTAFEPDADWFDFLNTLAGQTAIAIESATLFESLQRSNLELVMAYDATIEGWSRALDLRDKETEGHSLRVTEMTLKLAQAFGLSEAELMQVRWGALLHDIGKMGIPDGILLKPGPLTDEEWVVMKKHPTFAYELLAPVRHLRLALDLPYCHHEKWDGTGYPRGLKGDQIPLAARIFAVVDVWDALSSDRPYRAAWANEKVREHIRTSAGTHFDPQAVAEFLKIME